MERESRGSTAAMSGAGAMGLMQLIPSTYAEMMGIPQSRISEIPTQAYWDTDSNLRAGIRYLAYVLNDQNGNRYWALAAYNGGTTITRRWRVAGLDAVPPYGRYDETADYAQIVLRNYLSHRPDVQTYVPAPMPSSHIPGALAMLERVPSA
jgi:soluble lytic murein transglycosylase-like protein